MEILLASSKTAILNIIIKRDSKRKIKFFGGKMLTARDNRQIFRISIPEI